MRWTSLLVSLALVASAAGCASDGEEEATPTDAAAVDTEPETEATEPQAEPETETAETEPETEAETEPETDEPEPEPEPIEPVVYEGSGDDVIDVESFELPMVATIEHQGSSNFALLSYGESDNRDLLVNTIGDYSGTRPLNFIDDPSEFEITADGSWTITITSLLEQPTLAETTTGTGDEVLFVDTGSGRLTLTHDGDSNFAVFAYGSTRDLLVNEIGGYEGTVRLPDALALEIQADGNWTAEVG
jgi:hypothetical protein